MNPYLSEAAKAFLEAGARGGGLVSDGPVPDEFDHGWALHPFDGRAHWWQSNGATSSRDGLVEIQAYLSKCGLRRLTTAAAPLLQVGNWTMCERCAVAMLRKMKT